MDQRHLQSAYKNEEEEHLARILSILVWASWGVYLFVIFASLYFNDWETIAVTLIGCVLLVVLLVLLRRRLLSASSLAVVLIELATVTVIATVGQGIRDLAIVAYPIVIIFAGLTLNRLWFRLCVGLTMVAVCWLALGETYGWFVTKPFGGAITNWFYLAGAMFIFLLAALAVELLATNMRKSLEQARKEIAQRKRAEEALQESEERFKLSMDATNDGLWDWDIKTDGGYFSPGYFRMLGYEAGDFPMEGSTWKDLIHPDDREHALRANMDCIEGRSETFEVEYRMRARSGKWCWILRRGKCVARDEHGRASRLLGTHMNITERKLAEEQLRYQSTHDVLTGIYNRAFYETELVRLERGRDFAVSIIVADVDKLKVVNDALGHAAGDTLLRHTANVLRSVLREGDILARIGGDEFSALLPATDSKTAGNIVSRIRERLAEQDIKNPDLPVKLSIGMATAETNNLTEAFKIADQRMYADKAARKSSANPAHIS